MPETAQMARWRLEEGREWPGDDPKTWKGLAQAAHKKQLAPHEKGAPKDALSKSPYRATENGDF